jgi:hypothetical protein
MKIFNIRSLQFHQQVSAIQGITGTPIATYQDRDPVTGQRNLIGADGGQLSARYLSANEPEATPLLIRATSLGLPATIANR